MKIVVLLLWYLFSNHVYADTTVILPQFHYEKTTLALIKPNVSEDNIAKHPYITTGIFFKKGDVPNFNSLIATDVTKEFPMQIKPHNYYDDGSVRFAIITVYLDGNSIPENIHITKGTSTYKEMPDVAIDVLPKIQVRLKTASGQQHNFDLKNEFSEKNSWSTGKLFQEKRFTTKIFEGLNIDFDVTRFHNGHYKTDVVFHYDRILETPMQDIVYDAELYVNDKLFKTFTNVTHHHHTKWRYPILFGYQRANSALIDINRAMSLGVFPRLDLTLGTSSDAIENDYAKTQENFKSIYDSGLLAYAMPGTGARDEIAIFPQWTTRYLVSGDEKARYVTLQHAEIASFIPWHFYNPQTNLPANTIEYPKVWIDYRATPDINGINPFQETSKWIIDTAHQSSLVYVPFIISGERYYYDTMESIYMNNRLRMGPDPYAPYRPQAYEQIRAYGWFRRAAGEMQSILDTKKDPNAAYIIKANQGDLDFLYKSLLLYGNLGPRLNQTYIEGQNKNVMGELEGALQGYGNLARGNNSNFMQDLASLGIGFEAGLGLQPWLKEFSLWQSKFISGRFLQKHNGFPPEYGTAFNIMQFFEDPNGYGMPDQPRIGILSRWRDVFKKSIDSGEFTEKTKEISETGITGYPDSAAMFTAYSRASNAQLFNITKNPDNLEAFGFLVQFLPMAMKDYVINPSYRITPIFHDGIPLSYNNIILGSDGDNTLDDVLSHSLVYGGKGADTIKFDKKLSTGFLFGGDGNDYIDASYGYTTLDDVSHNNITSSGSYLFGGDGDDTLVVSWGNNILKGDENLGQGSDAFVFTGLHIGRNLVQDFDTKRDVIKICRKFKGFSGDYDIQHHLETTKNGFAILYFSNKEQSSEYIILKNVYPNQITQSNVIADNSCE